MSRTAVRDLRVGLAVLVVLGGLFSLLVLARVGPGFLGPRRLLDVVFQDGQGVRVGCPVRVAGIDAGRVVDLRLFEAEDGLKVRLRLSLPAEVADHLKQDVRIAIQSGLTGQSTVNIVSAGRSRVSLVPGQTVQGVESSFLDPILEQVGLGAGERGHMKQVIAQVRETIEQAAPRLNQSLDAITQTATEVRGTVATVRPRIEATVAEVETMVKGLDAQRLNQIVSRVETAIAQFQQLVSEGKPLLLATLESVEVLAGELSEFAVDNRPHLNELIVGLNDSRKRLDIVLGNTQEITEQGVQMIAQNRADVERTLANVRDATGFGLKLVQKLYGNPFYLSPFYKPRPEDIKAQEMYDSANAFLLGAKEFHDALKTLQSMQGKPTMTPREKEAYNRLFARAWELTGLLGQMQSQLAEGIRENSGNARR